MDRDKAWLSYVQRCRAGAWIVTGMCSGPDNKEYSCDITILSGSVAERPIGEDLVMGAARSKRRSVYLAEAVAAVLTGLSLAISSLNLRGSLVIVLGLVAGAPWPSLIPCCYWAARLDLAGR